MSHISDEQMDVAASAARSQYFGEEVCLKFSDCTDIVKNSWRRVACAVLTSAPASAPTVQADDAGCAACVTCGHAVPDIPPAAQEDEVAIISSQMNTGVYWRTWPKDMPDGTKLFDRQRVKQEPLAEDQIFKIARDCLDSYEVARAIEAAHGIISPKP